MSEEIAANARQVIATSVAEDEFARFVEAMDLDVNETQMTSEERDAFRGLKRTILRAMEACRLVIDDNGQPVYTPQVGNNTKPITFYEPDGAALMSMDKKKAGENVAKTYAAMGAMTKNDASRFAEMKGRDLKVCQALYLLFLA
jgi:hypothetical protein